MTTQVNSYKPDVAPTTINYTERNNELPQLQFVWGDKKPADLGKAEQYWTRNAFVQLAREAEKNTQIAAKYIFTHPQASSDVLKYSHQAQQLRAAAKNITV